MGKHVPEITAATLMGTTCWPFNFIHVREDRGKVSFIRQSCPSDCRHSAGEKKRNHTEHDMSNPTAEAAPFYSHTNIPNTWSPQQNTAQRIKWTRGGVLAQKLIGGEPTSASDVRLLPPPPLPPVVRPR